jgi:hypothetical protein
MKKWTGLPKGYKVKRGLRSGRQNLMVGSHKHSTQAYLDGYDRIKWGSSDSVCERDECKSGT